MHRVVTALLAAAFLCPVAAAAQCPELDACCRAGLEASKAADWKSLFTVVSNAAEGCDDGWIAEEYSERVSILLAERWDLLGQLHAISKSEPWFLEFVLKHINDPPDRAAKIHKLATTSCPREYRDLCPKIASVAASNFSRDADTWKH